MEEKSLPDGEKEVERNLRYQRKPDKLKHNTEFKNIYRIGKRETGNHVSIIYIKKPGFKFGISFRRDAKPAVKRNRAKRRLTEIIRKNEELLSKNIHLVIRVSKEGLDLSFHELMGEFNLLLRNAEICL